MLLFFSDHNCLPIKKGKLCYFSKSLFFLRLFDREEISETKMMKLFFLHFVKEFLCCFATVLKRKDIVVTKSPNLPSNKKVRHVQKKQKSKKIEINYARTNVRVQLIIKYSLIYCDVFHQWSSMMREKPWWTIMLLLPSLPCTHIRQLRNHHQYCSEQNSVQNKPPPNRTERTILTVNNISM